eukprot:TRINITY_DN13576_c1_g1_i1.p1 TRINITY_DN13576_c1_g1~~TRINITY_DN13576_c1_g1_i1.p1  ORF type:complete len:1124 (+),score=184.16 TRINITY_DN13576_c1_g1_i1:264-3635(+)
MPNDIESISSSIDDASCERSEESNTRPNEITMAGRDDSDHKLKHKVGKDKKKRSDKLRQIEKKLAKKEAKLLKKEAKLAKKQGRLAAGRALEVIAKTSPCSASNGTQVHTPGKRKAGDVGINNRSKKTKHFDAGTAKGSSETFRCKACEVDCTGEASFLDHLQGKKHCKKAGSGFQGLLPNDMGVIPKFSEYAQQMLGSEAAAVAADQASSQTDEHDVVELCPQKLANVLQSIQMVHSAYAASKPSQCNSSNATSVVANYDRQEQAARVPPRICTDKQHHWKARTDLPMFSFRDKLLKVMQDNQVTILEGETGSGKTTQAPQYILEDAAHHGRPCRIICTQPRRLAAVSVARRVADERSPDDGKLGDTVGYAVRHEHCASDRTCLMYCTTGVLLRRLQSAPDLQSVTHVVVDEVHERTMETDLLLLLLKRLCTQRKNLRVLLMSATFDSSAFRDYFGTAASELKIPGQLYPVQTYYLEDALQLTHHVLNPNAPWSKNCAPSWREPAEPMDPDTLEELDHSTVQARYCEFPHQVKHALRHCEPDVLNVELVTQLICSDIEIPSGGGTAVLVFVSGVKEIDQICDALVSESKFASQDARNWVLPLHAGLPHEEQSRVFMKPPAGVCKVIIATNVAETSLTIDDVGFVIDTTRMKENRFDNVKMMSCLEDVVISRANARQRRGRAGRVGPGICVHLVTKYRHDMLLHDHQLPEVSRTPLESLVLRILASPLAGQGVKQACNALLEPPSEEAVHRTLEELEDLGALRSPGADSEQLTELGEHLANLPLHPRLGKLVVIGAAFGIPRITDDALTLAAALSSRSPFVTPRDQRQDASRLRAKWSRELAPMEGMQSDHLAVVAAYEAWNEFPVFAKLDFAKVNLLSHKALQAMGILKRQLLEMISVSGIIGGGLRAVDAEIAGKRLGTDGVLSLLQGHEHGQACNLDRPGRSKLLAGLLCSALCPNIVRGAELGVKWNWTAAQGNAVLGPRATLTVRDRSSKNPVQVQIHTSSVHGGEQRNDGIKSPYLVYSELLKSGNSIRVRDVTPVTPFALLLFGSNLQAVKGEPGLLCLCGWLRFRVISDESRQLLGRVREQIGSIILHKLDKRGSDGPSKPCRLKEIVEAIIAAL